MTDLDKVVLVRDLYASDFDPERLDEFLADDCVYHGPEGDVEGIENLRAICAELHRAFPDLRFSVEALRVEGDEVEVHWSLRGTHRGSFRGEEGTGRPVEMTGRHVEVVRDGRIVERFGSADQLDLAPELREPGEGSGEAGEGDDAPMPMEADSQADGEEG